MRYKLPEYRFIIDNKELFKITLSLILYQICYSANNNTNKEEKERIIEFYAKIIFNFFKVKIEKSVKAVNDQIESKEDEHKENIKTNIPLIIESFKLNTNANNTNSNLKSNSKLDRNLIEKNYNFDKIASLIFFESEDININNSNNNNKKEGAEGDYMASEISKNNNNNVRIEEREEEEIINDNRSEISFTPSLQSQDTGKTYKEIIILDEPICNEKALFYPLKSNYDILAFVNDNFYYLFRFIFSIYDRVSKLFEYASEQNLEIFKVFFIAFRALIHKQLDQSNYEEICKELLGNEFYFFYSLDKILSSVKFFNLLNSLIYIFIYRLPSSFLVCTMILCQNKFLICFCSKRKEKTQ